MTYVAIMIDNKMNLKRFWSLKDEFTKAVGAFVDISVINIDDMWAYCDVDIDDGDSENSLAAKKLYEYIKSIPLQDTVPMQGVAVDWETMDDEAFETEMVMLKEDDE